jgi:hypothetical protein
VEVPGSNPGGPTSRWHELLFLHVSSPSRTRSWTDDQLRTAVASERSWRGTARALGLRGSSAGVLRTLKARATELRLDSSHIGRRPYALDKSASRQPYDPDEIDLFFIIDGDLAIYLIPSRVVAGKTSINVGAYAAYRVGDASSLVASPEAHHH